VHAATSSYNKIIAHNHQTNSAYEYRINSFGPHILTVFSLESRETINWDSVEASK